MHDTGNLGLGHTLDGLSQDPEGHDQGHTLDGRGHDLDLHQEGNPGVPDQGVALNGTFNKPFHILVLC